MTAVMPFLMFQGQAEEAMNRYVSLLPDSRIDAVERYGEAGAGKAGTVLRATFTVAGQRVMCIDSAMAHAFTFTPAFSFFVDCDSDEELRRLAGAMAEGGAYLMPLNNYGFSRLFCWINDRYGVSWQLNLP